MQTTPLRRAAPHEYRSLSTEVRNAGLLDRRLGYYSIRAVLTVTALGAGWACFFFLGDSWLTLCVAVFLGLTATQLGFLAHDAGHRQIFRSKRANRLTGLAIGNGLIGLSFGWWVPKHNAHHAYPNQIGRDPDIGAGLLGPPDADDSVTTPPGVAGWMARRQAELFFPLMLLRSTGLYYSGVQDLLRRRNRSVATEGVLLLAHAALYVTAVLWVLSPLKALAFIVVHQAVFSMYLGCSFAPNHKGMPLLDHGADMGFAERQVITARNVKGGWWTGFVFGGLNYQIEHHLFPTMPRPNLARVQSMVRTFCVENHLPYCEEGPIESYRTSMRGLRLA